MLFTPLPHYFSNRFYIFSRNMHVVKGFGRDVLMGPSSKIKEENRKKI
jgi:hypothetical protein